MYAFKFYSVKRKILSFQGGDDLMRRYLDMLTLLRTAGGRYQSSYLLPSRILKTLKRTNQVREINSALMSLYFYRSDLRVQ